MKPFKLINYMKETYSRELIICFDIDDRFSKEKDRHGMLRVMGRVKG